MSQMVTLQGAAAMTPGLKVGDPLVAFWLAQVNLRLRREVCWCWHQRAGRPDVGNGSLPPVVDGAMEALEWVRFREQKLQFFRSDPTAGYLSDTLTALERPSVDSTAPGTWAWVVRQLALDEAAQFVLALALAYRLDAGIAPVCSTCMNDLARPFPTLALAQYLWDTPTDLVACANRAHALYRYGLLRASDATEQGVDWQQPLVLPAALAEALVNPPGTAYIMPLRPVVKRPETLDQASELLAWRLAHKAPSALELIPMVGTAGSDFESWAASLSAPSGRRLLALPQQSALEPANLPWLTTLAWLQSADVVLPEHVLYAAGRLDGWLPQVLHIPLRWFIPITEQRALEGIPASALLPPVHVPTLTYNQRLQVFLEALGPHGERLRPGVEECARRFRFPARLVRRIAESLRSRPHLDADTLIAACRAEAQGELGQLAQRVEPRFSAAELILSELHQRQFDEVLRAMRSLTRVHYHWGTARVWNESGLAVLFCGPPGTGKTMAAEALAHALRLEMYRIDLSQVVNKYIGETEKNLKRIFDAAEQSDCLLFFDEADALFGKRTEVKDAHDRFANIEISYLLERMERFKGLAILATNRRKDLDEAFIRRLRYIMEFPVPDVAERERIWRQGFPAQVDTSALDFRYLAKQFALSGGYIRSVIFNACLQAAAADRAEHLPAGKVGRVTMDEVLIQLKRELQKMNRAAGNEQFGTYADKMAELTK